MTVGVFSYAKRAPQYKPRPMCRRKDAKRVQCFEESRWLPVLKIRGRGKWSAMLPLTKMGVCERHRRVLERVGGHGLITRGIWNWITQTARANGLPKPIASRTTVSFEPLERERLR